MLKIQTLLALLVVGCASSFHATEPLEADELEAVSFVEEAWRRSGLEEPPTACSEALDAPRVIRADSEAFAAFCGAPGPYEPGGEELFGACLLDGAWVVHDEAHPNQRIQRVIHAAIVELATCSNVDDPRVHPLGGARWGSVWSWAWHLLEGETPPGA